MKKSHKKMLIFQIIIFLIFILNSFVSNILGENNFIIFLLLALIIFKFVFGFERDRNRYTKDVMFEIVIFLFIFFLLFYISGIVIGFAKTNYLSWYGISTFVIPLVITIILREILRYMMLKKCEGCKFLFVTAFIMFLFVDISEAIYYAEFDTNYNTFIFVALSFLPALSSNIFCTYLTRKAGYKPVILYLLITRLYAYLIPIIPDPNEYITSIITFILPLVLLYKLHIFLQKDIDEEIDRDYKKRNVMSLILPTIVAVIMVYFTSGYFKYYALAVASGSMEPVIMKGDIVIVKKLEGNYEDLEKGQVLVFQYNGVVVVHRIIKIVKEGGEYYFYTKGDNNGAPDNYAVTEDMIIGTTNFTIPYAGYPTVWLNEM